ncbi:hypothetical protein DYB28_014190 [Aphanomyces astaci]|uniref:tRNA (guanine(46)-N(7))-methyltransferase n=1 Tax=Aphanomyces astaci TaxID=112090 RepID=A0A397CMU3_APHAT|nr:hypothetical protein DYB25_007059 [Aphanomyces astaci]RHY34034.1 hypothetical protein DYB34_010941 [Aphanomyces astaci]RHY45435.1 hypothetical protein DYB38_008114 [Aphanomyces astaci]RHY65284.1 hypothetical protein DYB30_006598 [Aphanomyces astaci]RHY89205.1 hypothetical protein DYB31_007979 [Aphanomyces astaci]
MNISVLPSSLKLKHCYIIFSVNTRFIRIRCLLYWFAHFFKVIMLRLLFRRRHRCLVGPLNAAASFSTKPSVRVRQHVNPLAQRYQEPITLPDWTAIFPPPPAKVHLDIGCARAQYLMKLAAIHPDTCFLGVEIREPLVVEALERMKVLGLPNAHVLHGNMNVHLDAIVASLTPEYTIGSVSIFHPDPWMKKRHVKRRVVNDAFVADLARVLPPSTPVFVQTDVRDLFEYMVETFQDHPDLYIHDNASQDTNAMGLPTDRESAVVAECGDIYRTTFRTKASTLA